VLLIARLTPINVYAHQQRISGTHKNLQRLVFCPIYSVVKYRPHQLALTNPASAGMGLAQLGVCKPLASSNPIFGVKQLSLNRELNHGCRVDAQYQIGFKFNLLLPGNSIRIDAALDLGDALFMAVNHAYDCNHAAYKDCANRNQQTTQTRNRVYKSHRIVSRILVELTGIEPVASWLQTRRSPS
jgi:hypothetical protein